MRKILVLIIVFAVFFLIMGAWWKNGLSPVNSKDSTTYDFVIPKGSAVRVVGNKLKEQGLIKDPVVFFVYIKKNNLDKAIQAGSYKLSPSMDLPTVLKTLGSGSEDIWVTIPEGYRAAEIAEVLEKSLETYEPSWVDALELQEGYLFPDTYLIPKGADVETVISIMKNTFNEKVKSIGLSADDPDLKRVVIIASLIEREAIRDDEKKMISSVIANRLEDGMSLDIDATLQYIRGKDASGNWWPVPTGDDKALNSFYNTYKNPGIPPGPISNPGIEAIRAAANPASSDYYFYIHDMEGNVHFAKNLTEHNTNVNRYLR